MQFLWRHSVTFKDQALLRFVMAFQNIKGLKEASGHNFLLADELHQAQRG